MSRIVSILALALAACLLIVPAAAAEGGGASDASADSGARRRVTTSEDYIDLAGLTATVTENFRARGVLHVDVGFDIPDSRLRARAERLMPRLRAACVDALMSYAGRQYRRGDVPDADRIAVLLQAAADEALGGEGARVVLTMVMVHDGR